MKTDTYARLLAIICSVFDAYSATLYLPSSQGREGKEKKEGGTYSLVASFSLGDTRVFHRTITEGQSLAGWILRDKKPLVVANYEQHRSNLGYYTEHGEAHIKAFMGCPVPSGGVLCVDSKRQYSFSDKDSKILQLFADLVSREGMDGQDSVQGNIASYFAQLGIIQSLRMQHKRWPVFLKNFLHTVAGATQYDYCAFASIDANETSYFIEGESSPLLPHGYERTHLPLNCGIAGWVFRDGRQPVFHDGISSSTHAFLPFGKIDSLPTFQSGICLPVMVNKSARGVLCLAHTHPREIDETLRSFVHQCVDHLSLFLENLYLQSRLNKLIPKTGKRESAHAHDSRAYMDFDNRPRTHVAYDKVVYGEGAYGDIAYDDVVYDDIVDNGMYDETDYDTGNYPDTEHTIRRQHIAALQKKRLEDE